MSVLVPDAARGLAVRLLEARGLSVTARNTRGDSLYLAAAGATLAIRVSSHARTPRQRTKHPNVATSIVIRAPKTRVQIAAMVDAASRIYARAVTRPAALP